MHTHTHTLQSAGDSKSALEKRPLPALPSLAEGRMPEEQSEEYQEITEGTTLIIAFSRIWIVGL